MKIKKFDDIIQENILDDEEDEENPRNWEVKVDGETDSYWEYKSDAVDQVLELIEQGGSEEGLDGYEDEDGEELDKYEIRDLLLDMNESEFYEKLDELKDFVGYDREIKLINLADEDEIEFLEED
jgi:hypothetical protein